MLMLLGMTKPDFSGNWTVNLEKSEHGDSSPKTLRLTQTKDSLFVERTTANDLSFVEKISFDGKTFTSTTTSKRRKSGSAHWDADSASFTENAVLGDVNDQDKTAFTVLEHWQLSGDGKQLTVETTLSNPAGQSVTSKAVYDKN